MSKSLPQRKNLRLKYYNYAQEGYYFITICVKNRMELLGKIIFNITDVGVDAHIDPKIELSLEGATNEGNRS